MSQMTATGIVALFSALSAASSGANHSLHGMLAMLSACRYVYIRARNDSSLPTYYVITVSFSELVLELSIPVVPSPPLNNRRKKVSLKTLNIGGSLLLLVSHCFVIFISPFEFGLSYSAY